MPHKDIHTGSLINNYLHNKQVDGLYISTAIKSFAASFISIFVPIYLLTLGFSIKDVAIYYLFGLTLSFLFFPIGLKLNSKIGVKKVMSLGIILSVFYYLLLNYLPAGNIKYIVVAIVSGIGSGIYWAGFHLEFSRYCDKGKEASETSFINILSRIAGAIGPIIGAILILETSFNVLFLLSSSLLILSIIPLFFTKNEKTKFNFSINGLLKADKKSKAISYGASGILGVVGGIFWPVLIFLSLNKVLSLGAIVSVTAVSEIIFLFFIGKLSDKHKNKVLRIGIFSHSLSWITRVLFLSPLGIFFNNMYSSFSSSLIDLPFAKIIYEKSKNSEDVSNYFLFRELHLWIGRALILLLVIFTSSIFLTFVVSFLATFLYFNLLKKK